MFKIFKSETLDDHDRAKSVWDKVVGLPRDQKDARSMRMRVGLLSRAFLDKTFVTGAEQTESYEMACAVAISQAKTKPTPPVATEFQSVQSTSGLVTAYLPLEYAQEAFALGTSYQKTDITAEQAISAMQMLADRVFLQEIKMDQPLQVLQFLREEVGFTLHTLPMDPAD